MNKSQFLGEFEIIVMASLVRLGDNAYGVTIIDDIKERAQRTVSVGALYATLSRLEQKKYVSSSLGKPTKERGGRARRYYQPTQLGMNQLNRSAQMFSAMLSSLPSWTLSLQS